MSLGLICNVTLLKAQDIINPVGVTMSLPNNLNSPLISIVNGSGLSEFPSITATHENNSQDNALLYFNGVNVIDFDLGGNFDIEGFAFWNAVGAGGTNFGVKDVIISASEDGVNFTPIPGSPIEFAEATPAPLSPETFSFNAIAATHIRIRALNNHGESSFTGISEVAFIGTSQVIENVINPVSASSTLNAAGTDINNTINGVGLATFPSLSANHEPTNPVNSWISIDTTGDIDFDLGGTFLVDGLAFWNQNAGGPGPDGTSGINDILMYASDDGTNYTLIPGSPDAFAQVLTGDSPPELFAFPEVTASFIRIEVLNNHGDSMFTGFAEIAFSGIEVLSITDSVLADAISLYPNPANDLVTINNGSNSILDAIRVYDMNGRMVKQIQIREAGSDQTINVSDLSTGIYMIHIFSNEANVVKRLIKE